MFQKWMRLKTALTLLILCLSTHVTFANLAYVPNQNNNTVSVIDTDLNTLVTTLSVSTTSGSAAAATPDGKFVYITGANVVSVIDTASNTVTALISIPSPSAIATASSGKLAYVVTQGTTIAVINTQTNALTGALIPVPGAMHLASIAVTPNGNFIYAADPLAGTVFVINTTTHVTSSLTAGAIPLSVAITPDGLLALIANYGGQSISIIQTSDNSILDTVSLPLESPIAVTVSPTGQFAYVLTAVDTFYSINMSSFALSAPLSVTSTGQSGAVAAAPNGLFAYAVNPSTTAVSVINVSSGLQLTSLISVGGHPISIAILPNFPPQGATAKQKHNDFGLEYELFNSLHWGASPSPSTVGYFIYRNGVKIATLNSSTLHYQDHNIKKGATTLYSITAFNSAGVETAPVRISVK